MRKLICFFVFLLVLCLGKTDYAATIQQANEDRVEELLTSEGIIIENLSLNGKYVQFGEFNDFSGVIKGFDNLNSGVVMTNGSVNDTIFGPERSTFVSTATCSNINSQELKSITTHGNHLYDIAYIEFDVTSDTGYISFQYIFASEEFDQNPKFNDTFGLFADGKNVAIVEELQQNWGRSKDVSMMSVKNTEYHYDNINGSNFGFLGYTSLLSCEVLTTPGTSVHFKLVIGDLSDRIYDSAIFIKGFTNKPAPEHEVNPDPSTREIINFSKKVSSIQVILSNGQIYKNITAKNNVGGTPKVDDYYLIIKDELIYGAKLKVEYVFEIENTSHELYRDFMITDKLESNFKYNKKENLLTLNKTNKDVGWYIEDDKVKYKHSGVLNQNDKIELKLVLSTLLSNEEAIYSNKASFQLDVSKGALAGKMTLNSKAEDVVIIPPFGKENKTNYKLLVISLIIIFICYIIVRVCKKR